MIRTNSVRRRENSCKVRAILSHRIENRILHNLEPSVRCIMVNRLSYFQGKEWELNTKELHENDAGR